MIRNDLPMRVANAGMFHRLGLTEALAAETGLPQRAKIAGAVSLACWIVVMIFASLNVEGPPKVLLRRRLIDPWSRPSEVPAPRLLNRSPPMLALMAANSGDPTNGRRSACSRQCRAHDQD